MGCKVLVRDIRGLGWETHPEAARWKVIDGALIIFRLNGSPITVYDCTEWVEVAEIK